MYKALRFTLISLLMMLCGTAFAEDVTLAAGTNGSACTVNDQDGIKVGKSSAGGDMTITVPANTVKLTLHAAAWKGVQDLSVSITGATADPESITLTPDVGISNNSPFTLAGNEDDFKFEIALSDVATETTLTLAANKRFVVWGASAVVSTGGGEEPQTETKAIYLKPGIWDAADATERFAAYLFNSDEDNTWVDFAPVGEENVYYTATIPTSYAKMILVRMNGETTENKWDNKWNQTGDIDISNLVANTLYKITDWSAYEVATYPEPTLNTYTVTFQTNLGWRSVYAYAWTGETPIKAWPGEEITRTLNEGVYTYEFQAYDAPANIIFNDGTTGGTVGENQTADLVFKNGEAYSLIENRIATIADLNALADKTEFKFTGEAFVVAVAEKTTKNGTAKYVYIHDNSGNSLIYDATSANTTDIEAGRFINPNWTGKVSIYKNLFEVTPDQALTVGVSKYDVSYPDFSERELNKVVSLKDVESFTVNGSNITINVKGADKSFEESYGLAGYNQFGIEIPAAEEGKLYEIIGVVGKYNDNLQFWPIEIKEQTAPEPEQELSFYVVGTMTNPEWEINDAYKMTLNEELEKQGTKEFSLTASLGIDTQIKVVSSYDGKTVTSWYPAGEGNNYVIPGTDEYTITCRPNEEGDAVWNQNVVYVAKKTQEPEPVVIENMYLVGDFTGGWPTQDAETQAWDWSMAKEMTKSTDSEKANIWTYEIKGFEAEAKTYEYKVSANKNWDGYKLPDGAENFKYEFGTEGKPAGKYDLLFTVDTKENTVDLTTTKIEETQPAEPTIADGTYYLKNKKAEKYVSAETGLLQEEGSPFTFKFDSKTGTYTITTADFFANRQWFVEGNADDGYTISYLADSQKKYFAVDGREGLTELNEVPADGSATWLILPQSTEPEPVVINSMAIVGDFTGGWPTKNEETGEWDWSMAKAMTKTESTWNLTVEGFEAEAKKYEYKAVANGKYGDYELPAEGNYDFEFGTPEYPAGKYNLTFVADTENHTLSLLAEKVEEPQPEPEWVDLIVNGNMEGESNECFYVTEQGIGGPFLAPFTEGIGKDGSKAVKVDSYNDPGQDWDSQFFIRLPYQIPAGTKYRVSFDYKADKAGDFDTQAHTEPGGYIHWAAIGSGSFTTEWQTFEAEGTISADMSKDDKLMQTIAFNLAKNKVATRFIFDNVKFEVYADIKTLTKNPATNPQPYTKPVFNSMAIAGDFLGLPAGEDGSEPNWDLANGWQMTQDAENEAVWTLVVDEFTAEAKTYYYKAAANGSWDGYQLPKEGNADYNFDTPNLGAGKYKLTFTVDTRKHSLNLDVEKLDVTTYTATFTTDAEWEKVYAYAWSGTEGQEGFKKFLGDWPGTEIEANADGIYTVNIESKDAPEKIIFNNGTGGEGNQTADLDFVNGGTYEFKKPSGEEDPIKVAPEGYAFVTNGNLAGDDVSNYKMKEYPSADIVDAAIVDGAGTNGSRGILVKTADDASVLDENGELKKDENGDNVHEALAWDSQFWIVLPDALPAGTKVHVEFDYKASKAAKASTQSHGNPGAYMHWAAIGDVNFTTEWQSFSTDFTVASEADGMQSIAFNLQEEKSATDYHFDNFGVWYEKPVEINSMAIVGDFIGGEPTEEDAEPWWNPANGWQMEKDAENPAIWTLTKEFTAEAKTYEYKATANGNWTDYVLPEGDNANFEFGTDEYPAGDYKLVFTVDTENNRLDLVVKPATVQTFAATFSTNAYWWEDVYAYAWSGEGENVNEYLGAWPGTKMKVAIDGVYTVTVEGEVAPEKIIFNNGNGGKGNQTEDLAFEDGKIYTYIFNPTFDFENNNGNWADKATFENGTVMDDITLTANENVNYTSRQLRVNTSGSITLTAPEGKRIVKIEFKALNSDKFGLAPTEGVAMTKKLTQGSGEDETTVYSIWTWTGNSTEVTFEHAKTIRQPKFGFINVTLEDAPDTYTAEFTTNAGWEKVYAYAWYEAPEGEVGTAQLTGDWPGLEITDTKNDEGVYTATFQSYLKPSFIIFSNGLEGEEKQQTDNLAFENGGAYSYMIEVPVTHTWDFTQWSEATVRNLKADAATSKVEGWSDVEKKADAEADADPTEASKDNCFWATVTPDENGELAANGVTIAELKGLSFNPTYATARSLAIAVNYPVALSTYAGPAYLWLGGGGKNVDCFVINNVKTGTTIKMGVESHKTSEGRGVQLFVDNAGARGDKLLGTDGNEVAVPKTYEDQEWVVAGEEGEVVNVIVYNTKGCHIYYIDAEIGEAPVVIPDPEYYLVFSADDWAVKEDNKLALNTEAANGAEEYMITRDIAADAQFKVVKVQGETQTWYPDGTGNAYGENGELTEAGNYTIYFRPNADGGEDWFNGVIYANLNYTDGIASIKAAMENGAAIYTLQGVRVNNVKKGGMYIINGRKVAIK